jgi:hypothetical protein
MTKRKGFGAAVKTAAAAADAPKEKTRTGALGMKIQPEILAEMRRLAWKLSEEKGFRVTLVQLTEEAYADLLSKYRTRKLA